MARTFLPALAASPGKGMPGGVGTGARSAYVLAAVLGSAGVLHFVAPKPFESIVPRVLGRPRPWVYASGVAELSCAAALLPSRTRRLGGLAAAALFVAVFPANVQMALDSGGEQRALAYQPVVAYGRLPLQVPLVLWAVRVARGAVG